MAISPQLNQSEKQQGSPSSNLQSGSARNQSNPPRRIALTCTGHFVCSPVLGLIGSTAFSVDARFGSSLAIYARIATSTTLLLRSSNTILSYVSRFVCQV